MLYRNETTPVPPIKCRRETVPWWIPLFITGTILFITICFKLGRTISELVAQHKLLSDPDRRIRTPIRSILHRSRDVEVGIEETNSPIMGGPPSRKVMRHLEQSGTSSESDCDESDEANKVSLKTSAIKEGIRVENHSTQVITVNEHSAPIRVNRPRFYVHQISEPTFRTRKFSTRNSSICETDVPKVLESTEMHKSFASNDRPILDAMLLRDSCLSIRELSLYERWTKWLRETRVGLTARQQLNMKLYCEQYTTVSYPAGIVMYCSATDRIGFILSYPSIIDLVAIPPTMFAAFQTHRHIDLNFVRAACLFNYVDVLTYLGMITSNRSINSARICFALFTMWMVGSGLMHGIEHLGDFWDDKMHRGKWSFFESCYFLLVTLSTVGYGDYVTRTTLGKLFICIFIPVAMGVSASFIPELLRNLNHNAITTDRYESINGEKHVIVCGNFDNGSLRTFIKGFLFGGRTKGRVRLNLVILRPIPIDLALKAILSHYHAWVRYFVGTPNNPQDLARTKLKDARAAIVLATPNAKLRDSEDAANIMQAIALKARKKTLRVVLQLHTFRNKDEQVTHHMHLQKNVNSFFFFFVGLVTNALSLVLVRTEPSNSSAPYPLEAVVFNKLIILCLINNFPRWTYLVNDMVVCMEELKLGLMAYNCLAPGFATLILNLLNIYGNKNPIKHFERWREEYEYGFRMEMHDVGISFEFDKINMRELAVFMYQKWNTVLLAVRCTEPAAMWINPGEFNFPVDSARMRAIVIAKDYSEALQMQHYCTACYSHLLGRSCGCRKPHHDTGHKVTIERDLALYEQIGQYRQLKKNSIHDSYHQNETKPSETHHHVYRHSITMASPLSTDYRKQLFSMVNGRGASTQPGYLRQRRDSHISHDLSNPSWLSVEEEKLNQPAAEAKIDRTGSFHWTDDVPLAKAILTPNQAAEYNFNQHFLVCVVGHPTSGPLNLENFIMPLRFHWQRVRDIVILGNRKLIGLNEWTKLKNFPRIFIVDGDPCSFTDLHAVQLCHCTACVILGDAGDDADTHCVDVCLQDRKTLLCAMNIRSLLQRERQLVHLTTELRYERNAHLFSSVDTQEHDYKLPVWFNEPFARGFIFSNSLLYSCLSSLFYNDEVFRFLRVLISGQSADEIEASFAVGVGLQPALPGQTYRMNGVNVTVRGFDQPPFKFMADEQRRKPLLFGEVYLRCMTCWQILCLGIYRLEARGFRYVLANPAPDMKLYAQDMFFCFMPISQTDGPNEWKFSNVQTWNTA